MAGGDDLSEPSGAGIPARQRADERYTLRGGGQLQEPGDQDVLLKAERRVIDTVLATGEKRMALQPLAEPSPEPGPDIVITPAEPFGGFDWIRPVRKDPVPPPENECKCELNLSPDISEGAYSGTFRLGGAKTKRGPYVIYCPSGAFQFRHDTGGPHNPWVSVLTGDMTCGDEIRFKALTDVIGTREEIVGRWGAVECRQFVGFKPGKPQQAGVCDCDAFCVTIDENFNVERATGCTLELPQANPNAIPPIGPLDAWAPIVVNTEGDPAVDWSWTAKSDQGYVSILRFTPLGKRFKCGELDVFFVQPTQAALDSLRRGVAWVDDTVTVDVFGECANIPIILTLSQSGGRVELFSRPEVIKSLVSGPCDKYSGSDCDRVFEGKARYASIENDEGIADMWNEGCLPQRYRDTMRRLCEVGWYFATRGAMSVNKYFSRTGEYFPGPDIPPGPTIEGYDFTIDFFNKMVEVAGASDLNHIVASGLGAEIPPIRDDTDVCDAMMRALDALTKYLFRSNHKHALPGGRTTDVGFEDLEDVFKHSDQRDCKNLAHARDATALLNVKARNWRLLHGVTGADDVWVDSKLNRLWAAVKDNAISVDEWSGSAIKTNDLHESDFLSAVGKTERHESEDYAPDITILYVHGYERELGVPPIVSIQWGFGRETMIDIESLKREGKKCTGVLVILGCASADIASYFPNTSCRLLLADVLATAEGQQLLDTLIDVILEARGDPHFSWQDLLSDKRLTTIPGTTNRNYFDDKVSGGKGASEPIWPSKWTK
ncbi:MAG: hypothetical protein H6839_08630 [Planctomycetes bacterium]|nr:hypothetical protein [Planctomycetota bacterium]